MNWTNEKIKSVNDMEFTTEIIWNKTWYYLVWKEPRCTILKSWLKWDSCTVMVCIRYRDDEWRLTWSLDLIWFADNVEEWKNMMMKMYNKALNFKIPTWKE